ncbi:MAG: hypothetical protein SF051_12805 [Elusimicrobiota bacterium]|nr:hypothetical protein [Elusimicrobiota bacterium]
MKTVRLAALVLFGAVARAAAEPAEEMRGAPDMNPGPSAIGSLTELFSYSAAVDRTFSAAFEGVMVCARGGGSIGLRVEPGASDAVRGVTVICRDVVAHDESIDEATVTPDLLGRYNRSFGRNLRVDEGVFGFGPGHPAPGGVPSLFFTPITPEHARPAVHGVIADRDTPREC